MLIKQISVFLPNRKGALAQLTGILEKNGVDIRAIAVFDTTEFGILRLVVNDPERCVEVLNREGEVAKVSEALAVEPEDEPGSLNRIFQLLADHEINVEYIYSYVMRKSEMPYVVLKVDQPREAADVLEQAGIKVVGE